MVTPDAATAAVPGATGTPGQGGSDKLGWRVARRLAESVIRRGWPVGARLGTEMELLEALGVSREPFREGIRLLELQGIGVLHGDVRSPAGAQRHGRGGRAHSRR